MAFGMMLNDEVPNFIHAGTTFCLSNRVHVSSVADTKYELFDTLRGHG